MIVTSCMLIGMDVLIVISYDEILQIFNNSYEDYSYQWIICFKFLSLKFFISFAQRHFGLYSSILGYRLQTSVNSLVYSKFLTQSQSEETATEGNFINLTQRDSACLNGIFQIFPQLFVMPVQLTILTCMLFDKVGQSAFYAIIVLFIYMILGSFLSSRIFKISEALFNCQDERLELTSETLDNILSLKLNGLDKIQRNKVAL